MISKEQLRLVRPSESLLPSYIAAGEEYRAQGVMTYAFMDPQRCDILSRIESFRTGIGLPPHYVKSDYLWLTDGSEFIAETSIRHELNDSLLRYGGHIGYGVRFGFWGQGIGTLLLQMALKHARDELGIDRALVTCNNENLASARVIEKNGGVLQDKIGNIIGGRAVVTRRYWIDQ